MQPNTAACAYLQRRPVHPAHPAHPARQALAKHLRAVRGLRRRQRVTDDPPRGTRPTLWTHGLVVALHEHREFTQDFVWSTDSFGHFGVA